MHLRHRIPQQMIRFNNQNSMINTPIRCVALILLISFAFPIICPGEIFSAPGIVVNEPTGYLMLLTQHVGLEIKIDNQFVGATPGSVFELTEGLHKVSVQHPDRRNWFEEDWFADVRILPNDTLRVPVVFKKSFSINSQPFGALVSGNRVLGETPIFFKLAENEMTQITLSKSGYRDTTFTIGQDDQRFYNIAMSVARAPIRFAPATDNPDERRSRSKVILYSAAGLALVSGGLSLYFRSRGNDKYDSYLNTGDPELIEKYYRDAEHFDRLAAVSFGVFQVSFVTSFYMLLKEANKEK